MGIAFATYNAYLCIAFMTGAPAGFHSSILQSGFNG